MMGNMNNSMNGSMNRMGGTSKDALLMAVNQAGFAVTEANLYLDTHPCDSQAIAYLKERMAGMTGSTLERYRQIVTELSDYQGIRFETGGLQEALAKARKENKAVFVDCYTSWCGPCKMMSSKVFPDKQAGDFFNPRFISLKIDMEKDEGKELAQKWNIRVFPTYLILDPQGEIVYTSQGYIPAEELIRRMNEGLEQWKNNIKTGK